MVADVDVLLGRYHDGTATPNWGGRATSLALADLISSNPRVGAVAPLNGSFLIQDFSSELPSTIDRAIARIRSRVETFLPSRRATGQLDFRTAEQRAASLLATRKPAPLLAELLRSLKQSDELWMNGEGDFILTHRPSLFRTMVIIHLARKMGKPVHLVNSILSKSPLEEGIPLDVREAVERCLRECTSICYRDEESHELHLELFPEVHARWAPDALFSWATSNFRDDILGAPWRGPLLERLPLSTQRFLQSGKAYVLLSGSSTRVRGKKSQRRAMGTLIDSLRTLGVDCVCAATDRPDHWMKIVADAKGAPFVPADVSLAVASKLLAHSYGFVSGRYHPSILASNLGVPTAYMVSNSHKTRSLQRLLGESNPREYGFYERESLATLVKEVELMVSMTAEQRSEIVNVARGLGELVRGYLGTL